MVNVIERMRASSTALASFVSCNYLGSIICVCSPNQELLVISKAEQDITQAEQLNDSAAVAGIGANSAMGGWQQLPLRMNMHACIYES